MKKRGDKDQLSHRPSKADKRLSHKLKVAQKTSRPVVRMGQTLDRDRDDERAWLDW